MNATLPIFHRSHPSPVGPLLLAASDAGLCRIGFPEERHPPRRDARWHEGSHPLIELAARQLDEYFAGTRREFDLPLETGGTPFQRRTWQALAGIGFGQTLSYAELAARIGAPRAVRAIGAANGRNPLPIVLPCHRVIGADGSLTGFGGGLAVKRFLLDHEAVARPGTSADLFATDAAPTGGATRRGSRRAAPGVGPAP